MDIAVMGDLESILGFKAIGLNVFPCEDFEQGRETLKTLAKSDTAIIYITEQLAQGMQAEIARFKDNVTPAIILIPGRQGSLGIAKAAVKGSVERAVGADILNT